MRYLLDTNIVSDMIRNPQGVVAQRIAIVGEANVCTSAIVAAELRFGAAKKGSQRLITQMERILATLEVLPFEEPTDTAYYAKLRVQIEAGGTPIGANDMLIAAQSLSLGHTLVTDNHREFSRIAGIALENWLRSEAT